MSWTFVELDEVGSTQAVAKGLAAMGAPEGTTVVAKSQSSGEGRLGRAWVSPVGGLYMTFLLRPGNLSRPELITLLTALAVVQGIKRSTDLTAKIRWPNDIMVGQKKLGGVIAEAQYYKKEITQILVGVGVNCNAPIAGAESAGEATSLVEELGRQVELSELKHSILDSFSALYERLKAGDDLLQLWAQSVGTIGKSVTAKMKTSETAFSYDALRVNSEGELVVKKDGTETVLHHEELEWLRENP